MTTASHTRYFCEERTRQHGQGYWDRLSMAVFDGCVDLNRHQIHAAAFDLRNPGSKGMVLADEIGLEKTTKPGWHRASMAERQWLLFVTCPASLWKERSPKHEETVQRLMFDVEDV